MSSYWNRNRKWPCMNTEIAFIEVLIKYSFYAVLYEL